MREEVMSAGLLCVAGERGLEHECATHPQTIVQRVAGWTPENFAREQVRRLVRQVFGPANNGKRQIIFSAVDPETEIGGLCMRVGETLAAETEAEVAVVGVRENSSDGEMRQAPRRADSSQFTPLRVIARQARHNFWIVPQDSGEPRSSVFLSTFLGEIRREFEYSIVQSHPAGESNEAAVMASLGDGIVLVLSAQRTRRASAISAKRMLEEARVNFLGTVLIDREFPMPERLYRRL